VNDTFGAQILLLRWHDYNARSMGTADAEKSCCCLKHGAGRRARRAARLAGKLRRAQRVQAQLKQVLVQAQLHARLLRDRKPHVVLAAGGRVSHTVGVTRLGSRLPQCSRATGSPAVAAPHKHACCLFATHMLALLSSHIPASRNSPTPPSTARALRLMQALVRTCHAAPLAAAHLRVLRLTCAGRQAGPRKTLLNRGRGPPAALPAGPAPAAASAAPHST